MIKKLTFEDCDEIATVQIVNQMIVAMMAGPHHTYKMSFVLLTREEKTSFIESYLKRLDIITKHFRQRLLQLENRARECSGILIVGYQPESRPAESNCGICGEKTCDDFFSSPPNTDEYPEKMCPLELMSFSSAISRGQQMASQLQASNVLAQSFGIAARKLGIIDAPFAMSVLLELGDNVRTAKDNQMHLKTN